MTHRPDPDLLSVSRAAARLGVPRTWLHREARAGRVPAIRAGQSLLIPLDRARAALIRRAEGEAAGATPEAGSPAEGGDADG